jgi:hypothetical protein
VLCLRYWVVDKLFGGLEVGGGLLFIFRFGFVVGLGLFLGLGLADEGGGEVGGVVLEEDDAIELILQLRTHGYLHHGTVA